MQPGIDEGATIVGSSETEIDAAPETVWDVLTEGRPRDDHVEARTG
jgi:hypothetical protein